MKLTHYLALALFLSACSNPESTFGVAGTQVLFNLHADLADPETFYAFPSPSDLRLTEEGAPNFRGFPNKAKVDLIDDLLARADERRGFPVIPVGYFAFTAALAAQDAETVIPASVESPILLIDVDPLSPNRGQLLPTVASTLEADPFVVDHVLTVAPRPGFILAPSRTYAMVVMRSLKDADGRLLGVPAVFDELKAGRTPAGHAAAAQLYAPLWATLKTLKISLDGIAAATVFTTGDVVAEVGEQADRMMDLYSLEITGLKVKPEDEDGDDGDHGTFCELVATVSYPQFQAGPPPFNKDSSSDEQIGWFQYGADGLPIVQRQEVAPIVITLPKTVMPVGGYPLAIYYHGSGGVADQGVNRGRVTEIGGDMTKGEGPAFVLAQHGLATGMSALPVNPERLPGATDIEYINLGNVGAFPDTFRQGMIEQRLFITALQDLRIAPSAVTLCTGMPALPAGETAYRFHADKLVAMGQSMGGMYTNMIGAVEPRIQAVVPTGAGGFWTYFILKTSLIPGAEKLLGVILNTPQKLTFMHPVMNLMSTAWEPAEPIVYTPRLAERPLPGHPVRPIYQPAGEGDSYFPTILYDAMALSYNHEQAGDLVWQSMQDALALKGIDGLLPYPASQNRVSVDGVPYTGVVVQYEGDGIYDPHGIYGQLDAVKHQYGCFLESFLATGIATLPAPQPLGTACPY
jgi:hypothetical protein